jgi:hypothetical protein
MKRLLFAFLLMVPAAAGVLTDGVNPVFAQAVITVAQLNGTVRDTRAA